MRLITRPFSSDMDEERLVFPYDQYIERGLEDVFTNQNLLDKCPILEKTLTADSTVLPDQAFRSAPELRPDADYRIMELGCSADYASG